MKKELIVMCKMKNNYLICLLAATVLVACSSGSSPLSSKKPLEAFADVAKMYTGISVGKLNTNRASDEDVKQAQKANDARKKLMEDGVGVEVPTESAGDFFEIIEPVKVLKVEPGSCCIYFDIECKVKVLESIPIESERSVQNRGILLVGYADDKPCVVEYYPTNPKTTLENRDEVEGNLLYEFPEGAIYTIHEKHVVRPCWADRYAQLDKFVVTFSDDPDLEEAGVRTKMKEEELSYNQMYE